MTTEANRIAVEFNDCYEDAWNAQDVAAVVDLYTNDAILVGHSIAVGKNGIAQLLRGILAQGWTGIEIEAQHARQLGDVVVVANTYVATGSGNSAGKRLEAKSSHVLVRQGEVWRTAMHTAA
jgi:uncharacterized protein (TIGR02246 family)